MKRFVMQLHTNTNNPGSKITFVVIDEDVCYCFKNTKCFLSPSISVKTSESENIFMYSKISKESFSKLFLK